VPPDDLLLAASRDDAEARLLVLTSQGIRAEIERRIDGFHLVVEPTGDDAQARETLAIWIEENRPRPALPELDPHRMNRTSDFALAYVAALALLAGHFALERFGDIDLARRLGSANAWEILHGEVFRIVTALTLHSDPQHALANTLIGGLFLASLSGRIGPGVALAGFLASGALGNLANAIHHQTGHNSIGASTAVFGVVGMLCGVEAWRRNRLALPWQGAWVPIGAGGALLAMLGAGGTDVDYAAHVYGLLAGIALGWGGARRWQNGPPRTAIQASYCLTTLAVLGVCWSVAWAGQHTG